MNRHARNERGILSPLCLPFHHDGDVVLGREVAANELPVANLGTRRLVPPPTRPSCLKEGKDRMRRMNRIHALPPPSRQHTSGKNPDLHKHDSHDKNAQRLSSPLLPSLPSLLKTLPSPSCPSRSSCPKPPHSSRPHPPIQPRLRVNHFLPNPLFLPPAEPQGAPRASTPPRKPHLS